MLRVSNYRQIPDNFRTGDGAPPPNGQEQNRQKIKGFERTKNSLADFPQLGGEIPPIFGKIMNKINDLEAMVPRGGFEPPTPAFSVRCSTN